MKYLYIEECLIFFEFVHRLVKNLSAQSQDPTTEGLQGPCWSMTSQGYYIWHGQRVTVHYHVANLSHCVVADARSGR